MGHRATGRRQHAVRGGKLNARTHKSETVRLAWRWRIAALLCLITTINYLDRQALAITGPVLIEEFGLSNTDFGLINSAFLFAYAFGHLLAGPFIDWVGTRRAFGIAVVAWSVAGMLHAAARGFTSLLFFRALLGFTEASNFPAALKSVAEWFPQADRSLAVGIVTVGPGLGAIIAPPLLGALTIAYGWQAAFLLPGAIGFAWLWLWLAWYDLPERHRRISEDERGLILRDRDVAEHAGRRIEWSRLLGYLRYREVWGLLLSRFANDGAFYFFVTWLPTYLVQAQGFDLRAIAVFAWIPFLAADAGSLAGGWAAQRLIAHGGTVDRARKLAIWTGAILVVIALLPLVSAGAATAIAAVALAMFAIQFKAANLFALPVDLFPAGEVASIWGLFGAVGSFGGMTFVAAVGWVTEHYSYEPVFWAVGLTQLVSAAAISLLVPKIVPLAAQRTHG
ncbi:MAG: MFS transporter [Gammaproteobacteria bacterium]|nr:MFS transporter [Gammaproteobacteria bacterium]